MTNALPASGRPSTLAPVARVARMLPRGGALPEASWLARHRGIVVLLWVHVVALVVVGVAAGVRPAGFLGAAALVAVCTLLASVDRLGRTARSLLSTLGLLTTSAALIGYFDGLIEAHFHFFISIAVISLYQAWAPYLLAVGYVLAHHVLLGTLMPHLVYNHHDAVHHPWLFAAVHGGAVLAESVACLVYWRVAEDALDVERANAETLSRTNAELSEANGAFSDLVGMLSHDLRSPLAVLIGRSEIALESWSELTPDMQMDFVRRVADTAAGMHAMLDHTLAVSTIESDGLEARPSPVPLGEAVRQALDEMPEPVGDVDLRGLDDLVVIADRGHLDQVLTNLFTNAAKYGGAALAVSAEAAGNAVEIRVSDSGPGVPPEFVPRLFERFSRAESARHGSTKGTGLGLYITRRLVQANGGDISYEETPGGGATFCVRLPGRRPESARGAVTRGQAGGATVLPTGHGPS